MDGPCHASLVGGWLAACGWRAVVGTSVVITMGINIISPHIQSVLQGLRSVVGRSKDGFRYYMTQQQADKVGWALTC